MVLRARKGKPKCLKFRYNMRWLLRNVHVILLFAFYCSWKVSVSGVLAVVGISEFLKLSSKFMLMFCSGNIFRAY